MSDTTIEAINKLLPNTVYAEPGPEPGEVVIVEGEGVNADKYYYLDDEQVETTLRKYVDTYGIIDGYSLFCADPIVRPWQ